MGVTAASEAKRALGASPVEPELGLSPVPTAGGGFRGRGRAGQTYLPTDILPLLPVVGSRWRMRSEPTGKQT